ncbi:MAG: DEAD/DEAH box helicase [Gaiellaceae bacterium MAG52_C11]|nr:DEAD/DEAH box helicase [Candidatus Gaiellasilicea maunaloa]
MTSAVDRLNPALQHHLVNSLAWSSLRPLQEDAMEPILAGAHVLLLAPTAGGKTEAAALPVLSRMLDEDWRGLSVLYLCPLKALLNNLEPRLSYLAGLVGRSAALWHGDIGQPVRKKIVSEPPDILLTTPESLEAILISRVVDSHHLLRHVRAVIVDELHAFAGDDRGWHLLSVLERVRKISGSEQQRVGLSATVGNPEALLEWLAGSLEGQRRVVAVEGRLPNADVTVDSVGSLPNAARVIAQLHVGEKRLVFCDSRARVEELGAGLRGAGVETYLSHSSLGVDERRRAEAAFTEGTNCVIVATSTLELGVDVGDLDRVIQIDAPFSVASFLQRLGRTGRRAGLERNALFLATDDESFLRACAIIRLWQDGYIEPIEPPAIPYHVLAQQLLALTLQEGRIGRRLWQEWIGAVPAFASMTDEVSGRVVDHLVAEGWLFDEQGLLSIGPEAERSLGWRHFTELTGIVASDPEIVVRYGQAEVGRVHPVSFRKDGVSGYSPILLGGRSWRVTQIDWRRRVADVVPDPRPGRSRWQGDARALSGVLCRAVRSVLTGSEVPARLTRRGSETLDRLREEFWWADNSTTSLVRSEDGTKRWWTFAGLRANADLSESLAELVRGTRSCDNLSIQLADAATVPEIETALRSRSGGGTATTGSSLHDLPKFAECLPRDLAALTVADRYADPASVEMCLRERIQTASSPP